MLTSDKIVKVKQIRFFETQRKTEPLVDSNKIGRHHDGSQPRRRSTSEFLASGRFRVRWNGVSADGWLWRVV